MARYLYLLRQQGSRPSQLQIFRVDGSTGDLAEVPGSPVTGVTTFYRLPMHPTGRFLYGTTDLRSFEGWSIDPATGLLRSMPGVPFEKTSGSLEMVVPSSGQFGYFPALSASSLGIQGYALDPGTGVPSALPGSPFGPTTRAPSGVIVPEYTTQICAPAVRRLYCVAQRTLSSAEKLVLSFAQDSSTGALSDLRVEASIPIQANPGFWLIQSVSDRFLYVGFGTLIQGFRVETSGALGAIPGLPIESGPLQSERLVQLVAHPSGRFLYAVAGNFNITGSDVAHVDGFEIDQQTGALRALASSPFLARNSVSTGQDDQNLLVLEPSGRFALLAVNGGILRVLVASDGSLTLGGGGVRQFMTSSDVALASW